MNAGPVSDRAHLAPGHAVGVTEDMIHDLVHGFYAKVRADPALAPIFNRAVGDGWDRHLAKMCDFWSSVVLMTGRFKGAPMATHARLPQLRATHFVRWLHLFAQTASTVCPPEAAALFVAKSQIIAQSLQLGIDAARGRAAATPTPMGSQERAQVSASGPPARASLPLDAFAYRRTDLFNETTVPPGLLKAHSTKAGVWALIHVIDGSLVYRIDDPRRLASATVLTPDGPPGLVEPTILHFVEPRQRVRFYVEFYRRETGSPSEGSS